jgi:hypothetical protein
MTTACQRKTSAWLLLLGSFWVAFSTYASVGAFTILPTRVGTITRASWLALPPTRTSSSLASHKEQRTPPPQDDDDCGDECEIDWDAMPSWEEDESDEDTTATPATPEGVARRRVQMEMQWQMQEASSECVVEEPQTCGSTPCPDCNAKGWSACRFCHGTAVLRIPPSATSQTSYQQPLGLSTAAPTAATATRQQKFFLPPSQFCACKICQQGVETCKSCQGSGWIATWTQLPNQLVGQHDKDDPPLP